MSGPIIIIGTGRSGTTIIHKVLCEHEKVYWLSGLIERDKWLSNNDLMDHADLPLFGSLLKRRYPPSEVYEFWDRHFNGFSATVRDLTSLDILPRRKEKFLKRINTLRSKKRNNLLFKITGWGRVDFLLNLFPNAKIIHVLRDGRAVANSLLNIGFWKGWYGPENWRWGLLEEPYKSQYLKHNKSFIALAGIQWKLVVNSIDQSTKNLKTNQFLEIRYEDFCAKPDLVISHILNFCKLPTSDRVNRFLAKTPIINNDNKWKNDLTPNQQNILNDTLEEDLEKRGYLITNPLTITSTTPYDHNP